jgi:iron(III) transport system ATP-binding protein
MNTLELHSIYKAYGSQRALENISLSVPTGSRTVIVGPSGSGKTTLLRMIAGFEFPDSGRLTLNGQTLVDSTHEVPAHQRLIGYVPQDGALFPHMTVAANIGFGLSTKGVEKQERIAELMDSVALDSNMAERWPHELSGGQQQRVALARALAQQPRLMLLDEPFSALDTGLRAAMRKLVARLLADAGVTTILVTHDQSEALSFADQLAVMRQGRLVQSGHPLDLYRYPDDEQTALSSVKPWSCPPGSKRAGRIATWGGYRSTTTGTTVQRKSCCDPSNFRSAVRSPAKPIHKAVKAW